MRLSIRSTYGRAVTLTVPRGETVEGLRTRLSQKVRLQTDRFILLHENRQLTAGKLLDLGVGDDSTLTLVPAMEAGLLTINAPLLKVLESLTEVQVEDFLSGRSPVTVVLGIGAQRMHVQLQLSAQNAAAQPQNLMAQYCRDLHTGPANSTNMSHSVSASSCNTGFPKPPSSKAPPAAKDSTSLLQPGSKNPRMSFNSSDPTSHLSTGHSPVICQHHSSPRDSCHSDHISPPVLPSQTFPSLGPHQNCPLQAATPVCSPGPGPTSPVPASTAKESTVSSAALQQTGAVIHSFVSPSPGIFSGTFSGTLAPSSQSIISHPQRGVAIILQILDDLLKAAFPPRDPPPTAPHLHRTAPNAPVSSLLTAGKCSKAENQPLATEVKHCFMDSTEENQKLNSEMNRFRFLMDQRRHQRGTCNRPKLSCTSEPYQRRICHASSAEKKTIVNLRLEPGADL
ncbi:midnolin-like [Thalassophryne amazonica]|uniref:midnolin-like n=1 Tax=Thalassophryne amazonica TaxID=390379 RepID=UPI001470FB91|nr:midnolin-like [Thalassophryne amazonica]